MKYPQLVSAHAVNAISDWLVTRLEQLGVDAPLVYSRLLLSLLHTPLQINALDLAEISDVNIGNIGRKNNRRFSSSDTEAIKRIAAIESLIVAVAADQQVSKVEKLVDELCEKLREIEDQQNSVDESHMDSTEIEPMKRSSSPEDPTKRYYRAFPALSKDLSKDQAIRVTPKPLTWPIHCGSSVKSGNYSIGSSGTTGVKRKPKRRRNQGISKGKTSFNRKCSNGGSVWDTDFEGSWEMGRDLIREFVMMQNNRNRSISESDASTFVEIKDIIDKNNTGINSSNAKHLVGNMIEQTNSDLYIDNKFVSDDNDGSSEFPVMSNALIIESPLESIAYTSLSEMEGSLSTAPRRLYEREVSNESLTMSIQEANNLASFEAKFDRNVEAIWDNYDDKFIQPAKPNAVESFWFNYYKHRYNDDHQIDNQSLLSLTSEEPMVTDLCHYAAPLEPSNEMSKSLYANRSDSQFDGASIAINSYKLLQASIKNDNIWSNFTTTENDCVKFNTNAIWNSVATTAGNTAKPSQMNSVEPQLNDIGSARPLEESNCYRDYEIPALLKWSTFETPFVPPSSTTSSTTSLSIQQNMSANTEDKIRRNLLENSYFYDTKSLPVMNNFTDHKLDVYTVEPSLNTHYYQFNHIDESTDVTHHQKDMAAPMTKQTANITLKNHSTRSKFVEVRPATTSANAKVCYTGHKPVSYADHMNGGIQFPRIQRITPPKVEEENLLTSERTHFRPIVSYADGFSFDIPDTLDEVKFCRSECGSIYLNEDKYMEYITRGYDEFSVKFCMKQNDLGCQTDDTKLDPLSLPDRSGSVCDRSASVSPDLNEGDDDLNSSFVLNEEIDTYNKSEPSFDLQNWTKGNGMKCSRNGNAHSLWEHCSGCSCDIVSKPANQMMINELSTDGDQIMSDLKCIYIGSNCDEDIDEDDHYCQDNGGTGGSNSAEDDKDVVTVEPNNLFFNVSKLISDMLKPETAKSFVRVINTNLLGEITSFEYENIKNIHDEEESDKELKNEMKLRTLWISEKNESSEFNNNISNNFVGGLWGDDNNIWQKNLRTSSDDSVRSNSGVIRDNGNWEHANLEQIWNSDEDKSPETIEIYDKPRDENEPSEDEYDLIECHELAMDNTALKRYIDLNRTLKRNNGNNNGNDDGLMSLHNNLNRCDRKRRHSASQSISEALEAMIGEGADQKLASMLNDELNVTTIITCNYWTTDTSSYISGKNAALEINPTSSILKHIPIISRPLTR